MSTWQSSALTALVLGGVFSSGVQAQSAEELAKSLNNPVAAMISVPIQVNYDQQMGALDEGSRWTTNVQPVIPFSLNDEWNLISRTIVPIISQDDVVMPNSSQSGIGDTVQSLFFSPVATTDSGWIWGAGPVALLPTGSDDYLTSEHWGLGPTGVALKQQGPWTYGVLANHLWSVAGDEARDDINASFVQPFLVYTTPTAWSLSLNSETTYDWQHDQLSLPMNLVLSKVTHIGSQVISLSAGGRYYLHSADNGPEGLGGRLAITFLFPK